MNAFPFEQKVSLTVGKFDGLHIGHDLLVDMILEKKINGFLSCIITFDRNPLRTISGRQEKVLMTKEEKYDFLSRKGIDILLELVFDETFMRMDARDFIQMLYDKLHLGYMAVGNDFTFGYRGSGDTRLLTALSKEFGFDLDVIDKKKSEEQIISSSLIRDEIMAGRIENANKLLGYSYYIIGNVIHGNRIGSSEIGRPTINIAPPEEKLLPRNGVYVSECVLLGRVFHGVTNVGFRPTIHERRKKISIETHILDFSSNVYDNQAKIIFKTFLRNEQKFETIQSLKRQIDADIRSTYRYFNH